MGWYNTCPDCGLTEKYGKPDCDCDLKRQTILMEKIKGNTVIDIFMVNNCIYTKYTNLYTKSGCDLDEYNSFIFKEIEEKSFYDAKLVSLGYTTYDLDVLFLIYPLFIPDMFLHCFCPIYLKLDEY